MSRSTSCQTEGQKDLLQILFTVFSLFSDPRSSCVHHHGASGLVLCSHKQILVSSPHSDKSKRRTKTVKKSVEPRWNQTFMYSPVHRREFRERMLELTVWDQARVREEESQFLGEVRTHGELMRNS